MSIDRERHGQRISSPVNGDCFRAAWSVILDVPNGDHIPNPHDERWWFTWLDFFGEFGLEPNHDSGNGPIWKQHRWVASVPSKNFKGSSHAIVMEGCKVLFDPSPQRRYHAGYNLLGADVVHTGHWLEVVDVHKLDALGGWRRTILRQEVARG